MAIKVTLRNPSQITSKVVSSATGKLILNRSIYQRLGSLTNNKTILDDYNNGRLPEEFVRFLDRMDTISDDTIISDPEILLLDEYLGSLGVTVEYFYSKDTVDIPQWIADFGTQTEYRILVDESDNTYLTTNSGSEILIAYTGV